jgi:SOS-response transcriptional repressors (RecA-mediated autopeptidases)
MASPQITISVIDSAFSLAHGLFMLTPEEIRAELIRQIDAGVVAQAQVARHLGIAPARVSEIRKGERRIQPDELAPLAELLKMVQPDPLRGTELSEPDMIPHLGKVAQGVWLEQTTDEESLPAVPYDRFRGDPAPVDLFAVTPEGTSMNRRFPAGSRLICRRVPFGSADVRSGQYVIVSRTAHDLRELTCKRLEIDGEGNYWLHSESDDPRFAEPWFIGRPDDGHFTDMEVCIEGRVIRAVQMLDLD